MNKEKITQEIVSIIEKALQTLSLTKEEIIIKLTEFIADDTDTTLIPLIINYYNNILKKFDTSQLYEVILNKLNEKEGEEEKK